MHRVRRERRQADGKVFRAFWIWRAVLYPLARGCDDGLPGLHIEHSFVGLYAQRSAEDDGVLVELWRLPRFQPAAGTVHAGNADRCWIRVSPANEFFDDLRLVACGWNDFGSWDQCCHRIRS